jgi:putative oxygen-independent coproporphyrinogen III oxidase
LAGIYIHIPFCKKACHYCDFYFSTTLNLVDKVVDAIIKEAEIMKYYIVEPVETIYFGGGTPSILDENQLEKIITGLYKHYNINKEIEFTLEANPDDLTDDKVKFYANLGINRLSIGTQSFNDGVLSFLNRSHTANQSKEAVERCYKYGIDNVSLDLIYGIPGQSKTQWGQNLKELVKLNPSHISCYSLTIEDKTVFGNWRNKGKLIPSEDDKVIEEYKFMVEFLTSHKYDQYEVSNFSRKGMQSKHNTSYWNQKPYLGLGPGAHSFNEKERHFNITSNPKYLKSISNNNAPFTTETLDEKEMITEYILTGIRTKWGVDFNLTSDKFNYSLLPSQLDYINSLVSEKLATFVNNKLILNSSGFFVSDSVALALIPE